MEDVKGRFCLVLGASKRMEACGDFLKNKFPRVWKDSTAQAKSERRPFSRCAGLKSRDDGAETRRSCVEAESSHEGQGVVRDAAERLELFDG